MLQALAVLGVDAVQGFVLAQPMPAGQLPAWLDNRPELAVWQAGSGPLLRLAEFLIWEERLILNLKEPKVAGTLACIMDVPRFEDEGAFVFSPPSDECRSCPLVSTLAQSGVLVSDRGLQQEAQQSMLDAALTEGPNSDAFKAAHSRLVEAILLGR